MRLNLADFQPLTLSEVLLHLIENSKLTESRKDYYKGQLQANKAAIDVYVSQTLEQERNQANWILVCPKILHELSRVGLRLEIDASGAYLDTAGYDANYGANPTANTLLGALNLGFQSSAPRLTCEQAEKSVGRKELISETLDAAIDAAISAYNTHHAGNATLFSAHGAIGKERVRRLKQEVDAVGTFEYHDGNSSDSIVLNKLWAAVANYMHSGNCMHAVGTANYSFTSFLMNELKPYKLADHAIDGRQLANLQPLEDYTLEHRQAVRAFVGNFLSTPPAGRAIGAIAGTVPLTHQDPHVKTGDDFTWESIYGKGGK